MIKQVTERKSTSEWYIFRCAEVERVTAANCRNKKPKLSISNNVESPFPIQPLLLRRASVPMWDMPWTAQMKTNYTETQDPVQSTQVEHMYWKSNPLSWPNNNKGFWRPGLTGLGGMLIITTVDSYKCNCSLSFFCLLRRRHPFSTCAMNSGIDIFIYLMIVFLHRTFFRVLYIEIWPMILIKFIITKTKKHFHHKRVCRKSIISFLSKR